MVLTVFYDIDGTIVGNVLPQVVEWHLVQRYQPSRKPMFKASLVDVLQHHLVRPRFADFHNGLSAALPHVEFFVYTASDHVWAHVLVPCIEKALGIKFNRPIFTRQHLVDDGAGDRHKSIVHVAPMAHRALAKKGYQVRAADMLQDTVLIDNNNLLVAAEYGHTLHCPTYNYVLYQDVLRHVPLSALRENMLAIQEELRVCGLFPPVHKQMSEEAFTAHYYAVLHQAVTSAARDCRDGWKDVFWSMLLRCAVSVASKRGFKGNAVEVINQKLQKQLQRHASEQKHSVQPGFMAEKRAAKSRKPSPKGRDISCVGEETSTVEQQQRPVEVLDWGLIRLVEDGCKAVKIDLDEICASLFKDLAQRMSSGGVWWSATGSLMDAVVIENQPVLKKPTMKTLQVLIYGYFQQVRVRSDHPWRVRRVAFISACSKLRVMGAVLVSAGKRKAPIVPKCSGTLHAGEESAPGPQTPQNTSPQSAPGPQNIAKTYRDNKASGIATARAYLQSQVQDQDRTVEAGIKGAIKIAGPMTPRPACEDEDSREDDGANESQRVCHILDTDKAAFYGDVWRLLPVRRHPPLHAQACEHDVQGGEGPAPTVHMHKLEAEDLLGMQLLMNPKKKASIDAMSVASSYVSRNSSRRAAGAKCSPSARNKDKAPSAGSSSRSSASSSESLCSGSGGGGDEGGETYYEEEVEEEEEDGLQSQGSLPLSSVSGRARQARQDPPQSAARPAAAAKARGRPAPAPAPTSRQPSSSSVSSTTSGSSDASMTSSMVSQLRRMQKQLSQEEILAMKRELLYQFECIEHKGTKLPKKLTMASSLDDMCTEYEHLKCDCEMDVSVQFQCRMLMAVVSGVEFLNGRFDPFDIKLDGWSESITDNIGDYDEIFEELHEKYKGKARVAPELKLLMALGGSAIMFHISKKMFGSLPGAEAVMRQNPELAWQFAAAAVASADDGGQVGGHAGHAGHGGGIMGLVGSLFGGSSGGGGGVGDFLGSMFGAPSAGGPPQATRPVMRGPNMDDILGDINLQAILGQAGAGATVKTPTPASPHTVDRVEMMSNVSESELSELQDTVSMCGVFVRKAPSVAASRRGTRGGGLTVTKKQSIDI
ncbi:hypothetical protein VOLCADRAFT_99759 [Volvox carteri f. nagariensis]|uniref:Uncharacterized protein n=1 Tax=Volvox carteri f. nagariensis TaxID=3068 RepID=D8UIK6_VOLCA|nr:uncharacterized protein VOLCADRAFT_99759 [Volvox carteri f. nagariensis]EFJ40430.1 hypothetical protein VOLCADRAFT_99759 [Volvox carteri f. nagariensis]|eukprot:XP_002958510.1 hypothetical protein VOLCADRAFT_99759 [Volvox carteri f. nagariensis]